MIRFICGATLSLVGAAMVAALMDFESRGMQWFDLLRLSVSIVFGLALIGAGLALIANPRVGGVHMFERKGR